MSRNTIIALAAFIIIALAATFFLMREHKKKEEANRFDKIKALVKANNLSDFLQGKTDAQVQAWANKLTVDEYNAVCAALANGGTATNAAQQPLLTSASTKLLAA